VAWNVLIIKNGKADSLSGFSPLAKE
jgi:hypothetical protein